MELFEKYNTVLDTIEKFDKAYDEYVIQRDNLKIEYEEMLNINQRNYENEVAFINDSLKKINAYLSIAKMHMVNLVNVSDVKMVDLKRLAQLAVQIDESRTGDPYAVELYVQAKAQQLYLEKKYEDIKVEFSDEKRRIINEYNSKRTELTKQMENTIVKINSFIESSATVDRLYKLLEKHRQAYLSFTENVDIKEFDNLLFFGYAKRLFHMPDDCKMRATQKFKNFYDIATDSLKFPISLDYSTLKKAVYFGYLKKMETFFLEGIQNIILNIAKYYSSTYNHVIFVDPVRYNASGLGVLEELTIGRNSFIEHVPKSEKEVTNLLERLTIMLSNADIAPEKKMELSETVLIFHNYPNGYNSNNISKIRQICANIEHYHLFVILTCQQDSGASVSEEILREMDNWYVGCQDNDIFVYTNEEPILFEWFKVPQRLPKDIREKYIDNRFKANLENDYEKRIGISNSIVNKKGKRYLDKIPVGIDEDGEIVKIDFENSNFATFICGASRSGKSTLLHTIITGIIMQSHPDDVEIWLIDFRLMEFSRYIEHLPPQVRYLLLDESPELAYDIIDRLSEIMQKRENRFMGKWQKLTEVPEDIYAPAIYVIIDEFSIMSEIIAKAGENNTQIDYKAKLQALLAKGAAVGIRFIFSSQGFTDGTKALSEFSKKQIQQRIAMKTDFQEIKATLELRSTSQNDQEYMETLEPHYALLRVPETSEGEHICKVHVLYISDYSKQEMYIDNLNQNFKAVQKYNYEDSFGYINKNPMIIDGSRYMSFISAKDFMMTELKKYQKEYGEGVLLFLGEPKRMTKVWSVSITDNFGENMLIVVPTLEQQIGVSILKSIENSLAFQDKHLEYWSAAQNKVKQQLKAIYDSKVVFDLSDICVELKDIRNKISKQIYEERYIVILGLESLYMEMEYNMGLQAEQEQKINNIIGNDETESQDFEQKLDLVLKGEISIETVKDFSIDFGSKEDKKLEDNIYDARNDLKFILKMGSKLGYHFFIYLNTISEFRQCKLEQEQFHHKVMLRMSKGDAMETVNASIAAQYENLAEHCFKYTNNLDSCTFRPYLHKGLSWSGWKIDEDGKVVHVDVEEEYLE